MPLLATCTIFLTVEEINPNKQKRIKVQFFFNKLQELNFANVNILCTNSFLFTIARTKPSKTPKVEKIDEAQESTVPDQEATGETESKNEVTNKDDTEVKVDTTDDTAKTKQETSPEIEETPRNTKQNEDGINSQNLVCFYSSLINNKIFVVSFFD